MTFLMVQLLRIQSDKFMQGKSCIDYISHALEVKFSCKDYNLGFQIGLVIADMFDVGLWSIDSAVWFPQCKTDNVVFLKN